MLGILHLTPGPDSQLGRASSALEPLVRRPEAAMKSKVQFVQSICFKLYKSWRNSLGASTIPQTILQHYLQHYHLDYLECCKTVWSLAGWMNVHQFAGWQRSLQLRSGYGMEWRWYKGHQNIPNMFVLLICSSLIITCDAWESIWRICCSF